MDRRGRKKPVGFLAGEDCFILLRPRSPPGHKWIAGGLTKSQKTSRPDHICPEIWSAMGKKQQAAEKAEWEALQPKLKAARDKRGLWEIPADDKDYLKILSDVRAKLSVPVAPAMPLFQSAMASLQSSGGPDAQQSSGAKRQRQDRAADKGPSEFWFGLVHTPVPMPAQESLHKEWAKLEGKNAWDYKAVRPKAQVIKEAKAGGRSVHFGSLMEQRHIKNSQLGK